jgi:hypothetical protein
MRVPVKKLLASAHIVAFVLIATSCGGSDNSAGSSGNDYPSEVRTNVLTSCQASAELQFSASVARSYCKCALERLEESYSVTELLEAEGRMARGEGSGIDMVSLAIGCLNN